MKKRLRSASVLEVVQELVRKRSNGSVSTILPQGKIGDLGDGGAGFAISGLGI